MSRIIGDTACPGCREQGRDKNGDHLMLYEDGGSYCNRCGFTERPGAHGRGPEDEGVSSPPKRILKRSVMELNEIQELPIAALKSRGISEKVAKHYGIHTEYDTSTREEVAHYYPITKSGKIIAYRKRRLPKEFCTEGESIKGQKVDMFGQAQCQVGGGKLVIVEGQDDMLAACQMLWERYPKFTPNVVSLVTGANTKSVADNLSFINSYKEVILCLDMDDAGKKATNDIYKMITSKVLLMSIPEKDPNEVLKKGKSAAFVSAFFNAVPYVPDGILSVDDVYDEAIEMPQWGRKWPWPSLDALTYGRRDGEGIFVGAAAKAGKTLWLSQMVQSIVENEGKKVFLCKFEQNPAQTVKEVAGKIAHKQFHIPGGDFTQEDLAEAVEKTKGKLLIFDASFTDVGQSNLWDRLKPAIRHAVLVEGVKDVFIDPITQLTDGMSASDTETELRRFSNEIQGMSKDLGFFYYCFCHLKAPEGSKTHEEGAKVKVAQFRGSRAMAEKTKFMLGIERDQYASDPAIRNTSKFHLLLNSSFGKSGSFEVKFDEDTGDYLEEPRRVGY